MMFAIVEWWIIVNLSFVAVLLGPTKRRIRYHNNVLPFRRLDPTGEA